jgi:lysozyme
MPDDVSDPVSPSMPQRIDPESSMAASPINRAGVVAGGTATVAAVSEASRLVSDVKYSVSSLGDWLLPVLLLCVVGLCGYLVWQRVQQRKGGWV